MIRGLCDVDVARAINCDSIRLSQLSVAIASSAYARNESSAWREFLDATVNRVGDQNVSVAINSNSSGRIKLSFARSLSAFRHVSYPFGQGTEPGKLGPRRLKSSLRECAHALLKLLNVLVRDVQYVKCSYSSTKGI